jgi:transposase
MKEIITDIFWKEIKQFIPKKKTKVGRPEVCPKKVLKGIAYVLKNAIIWAYMPSEFGKPSTIHGKFMKWSRMGIFDKIMMHLKSKYKTNNEENNWYAIDTSLKKAPFAKCGGKNPTDRAKRGIKQVIIVDRKGAPIDVALASANRHDSNLLMPLFENYKSDEKVRILAADSAFDSKNLRIFCKEKNIALLASTNPRRNKNIHPIAISHRWVVERTFGWFSWYRGLKICWAKLLISHLSFLQLAASIQLFRML